MSKAFIVIAALLPGTICLVSAGYMAAHGQSWLVWGTFLVVGVMLVCGVEFSRSSQE